MWLFTLVIIILSYLLLKLYNHMFFWKKEGVPYITSWPIVGSFKDMIFKRRNFAYIVEDLYKKYPDKRYYGTQNITEPSLIITDLDLIKRMTIRDFDHFTDHSRMGDPELEPLLHDNLFLLRGQKWREMRATLSPSFTGNKIRGMFHLMTDCVKQLNQHFLNQKGDIIEVEMKDIMGRFATDIIATCAFGVKSDSIKDKDNLFYKTGKSIVSSTAWMWIRAIIQMLVPRIARKFKITLFPKEITAFFANAIRETLRVRADENIIRPDMIHLLMTAKKEREIIEEKEEISAGFAAVDEDSRINKIKSSATTKGDLTIEDIVAQAFIFFLAGFDTVSTVLSHVLHELAVNEGAQKKLQDEIDETFGKSDGELNYETLANMKYLDMVISDVMSCITKKQGVPYIIPLPIVGNFKDVIFKRKNVAYVVEDLYKNYPDKRYYGIQNVTESCLVIRDLDLIKHTTIKDFDHFMDHIKMSDPELEPLLNKNLLLLRGQKWRDMRSTLSPSFTGNKIRGMFHLMTDCVKQFNQHFLNQSGEIIEVEMKDIMGRFANDIIATCAFGVKCDSIENKDSIFYKMGKSIFSNSVGMWIKAIIQTLVPKIAKKLNISMLPKGVATFFDSVIRETLNLRAEKNIIRPDMIYLLMEARKERETIEEMEEISAGFASVDEDNHSNKIKANVTAKGELTVEDIVAQAFIFFLAGFETVSTVLSHALHELAVNEDVQKKLQDEIDGVFKKSNGDLSYETLSNMKYLDTVISETLRKWPAAVGLNRMCVKDYQIDESVEHGEKAYLLKAGISIFIPSYGIQRDPQYFPNPDKFDPERFNEENKHKIVPYSYMPFGLGPRNCIGSRFALLEVKVLLTYLLSKFSIVPTADTIIPLVLSSDSSQICPKGFWLGLKKRNLK